MSVPVSSFEVTSLFSLFFQVTVTHSYGADYRDLNFALQAIATQRVKVKPLISHRLPLDEVFRDANVTCVDIVSFFVFRWEKPFH